jgi:hypothetical protein
MLENSINSNLDPTPLEAKSIEKDIDAARTHLIIMVLPKKKS